MSLFLHGFLGTKADFDPLFKFLPDSLKPVAIDLPGHGETPFNDDVVSFVKNACDRLKIRHLIGYSLGGRLALALKAHFPSAFDKTIILSGHPGLSDEKERVERWKKDLYWIEKLKELPFQEFLHLWYQQPIFASLQKDQKQLEAIIERRLKQNREGLIALLHNFSLAKTPLYPLHPQTLFVCGEEDLKFRALYHTLPPFVKTKVLANAGHILPLENPKGCADAIVDFIQS